MLKGWQCSKIGQLPYFGRMAAVAASKHSFSGRPARDAALHGLVGVAQEVAGQRDALGDGIDADQRVAAARHQRVGLDAVEAGERGRPVGEVRVAAVAGRLVLDDVAGEHHVGVRHVGDDVAGRVGAADLAQLDAALAEVERHAAG